MLPRRIAQDLPESERRRWRIVRLDSYETLPGLVLSADCDTGVCTMRIQLGVDTADDGTKTIKFDTRAHNFGPGGIAIIGR
jgi:hypothetical protein